MKLILVFLMILWGIKILFYVFSIRIPSGLKIITILFYLRWYRSLKVNFHKSMLVSVYVVDSWLTEVALMLNCKMDHLSFLYLGLPNGGDSHKFNLWHPLLVLIKNKNCQVGRIETFLRVVVCSCEVCHIQ